MRGGGGGERNETKHFPDFLLSLIYLMYKGLFEGRGGGGGLSKCLTLSTF